MQFTLHADERAVVQAVAAFAASQLRPAAAKADVAGKVEPALWAKLAELGVFGLLAAEDDGGLAVSATAWVACLQALAAADAGVALAVAEHGVAGQVLAAAGWQPERRSDLAAGKRLATVAHFGHASHLDATATGAGAKCQDGAWLITGSKDWVPAGAAAHWAIVGADGPQGLAWFAVSADQVEVVRQSVGEQLGLRSVAAAAWRLSGAVGDALQPVADQRVQAWQELSTAAVAVGVAQAALRAGGRYAQERVQFGAPIAQLQPIQLQIADSAVACDVAQLLVAKAAWQLDCDAQCKPMTLLAVHQAKIAASHAAVACADRAVQIHGGYGYTRDFPVERAMRDAAVLQVLHGTPARCKTLAARQLAA